MRNQLILGFLAVALCLISTASAAWVSRVNYNTDTCTGTVGAQIASVTAYKDSECVKVYQNGQVSGVKYTCVGSAITQESWSSDATCSGAPSATTAITASQCSNTTSADASGAAKSSSQQWFCDATNADPVASISFNGTTTKQYTDDTTCSAVDSASVVMIERRNFVAYTSYKSGSVAKLALSDCVPFDFTGQFKLWTLTTCDATRAITAVCDSASCSSCVITESAPLVSCSSVASFDQPAGQPLPFAQSCDASNTGRTLNAFKMPAATNTPSVASVYSSTSMVMITTHAGASCSSTGAVSYTVRPSGSCIKHTASNTWSDKVYGQSKATKYSVNSTGLYYASCTDQACSTCGEDVVVDSSNQCVVVGGSQVRSFSRRAVSSGNPWSSNKGLVAAYYKSPAQCQAAASTSWLNDTFQYDAHKYVLECSPVGNYYKRRWCNSTHFGWYACSDSLCDNCFEKWGTTANPTPACVNVTDYGVTDYSTEFNTMGTGGATYRSYVCGGDPFVMTSIPNILTSQLPPVAPPVRLNVEGTEGLSSPFQGWATPGVSDITGDNAPGAALSASLSGNAIAGIVIASIIGAALIGIFTFVCIIPMFTERAQKTARRAEIGEELDRVEKGGSKNNNASAQKPATSPASEKKAAEPSPKSTNGTAAAVAPKKDSPKSSSSKPSSPAATKKKTGNGNIVVDAYIESSSSESEKNDADSDSDSSSSEEAKPAKKTASPTTTNGTAAATTSPRPIVKKHDPNESSDTTEESSAAQPKKKKSTKKLTDAAPAPAPAPDAAEPTKKKKAAAKKTAKKSAAPAPKQASSSSSGSDAEDSTESS